MSRLNLLRSLMSAQDLVAYLIPQTDAHGSEYIHPKDKRREFISNFTGSTGTAVVTKDSAMLWTDGRYFLQANKELDLNEWTLMKDGLSDTLSIQDWLIKNISHGSVGFDGRFFSQAQYQLFTDRFKQANSKLTLNHVETNLIDKIRQSLNDNIQVDLKPLIQLDAKFTGQSTSQKLTKIRDEMKRLNGSLTVVSDLNEIAWLLNLRGQDIPYSAVFYCYCIVTLNECLIFTHLSRLTPEIKTFLSAEGEKFKFAEYDQFYSSLSELVNDGSNDKIIVNPQCNHVVHSLIPSLRCHNDISYLNRLKIIKNKNECDAARRIHLRDSVTLVKFFHYLQTNQDILDNEDEFNIGSYLDELRYQTEGCIGPSFETICGCGENGAIIHYKAKKGKAKIIKKNSLVLVDSGGHYVDMGTTDVTRTVFVGDSSQITDYQKVNDPII
jgi:Xaa-Pro aminopeptidase